MSTRTTKLRRVAATTTALGVAAAGALSLSAAPASAAGPKTIETPYAYQAWAYGTRVVAGTEQGAVGSGPTVRSLLGCTKMAPKKSYKNGAAQLRNDMVGAGAVVSRANTYRRPAKKMFGSRSYNSVADVVIGSQDGPRLVVGSLRSTANTFAKKGVFGGGGNVNFLQLDLLGDLPEQLDGPAQELVDAFNDNSNGAVKEVLEGAKASGVPVVIPGIGEISLGESYKRTNRRAVSVRTYALRVKLENGSVANIGHAFARTRRDVPHSIFSGRAHATEASLIQGNVRIGRYANIPLPCPGTNGKWTSVADAEAGVEGAAQLAALKSQAFGLQRRDGSAVGRTRSIIQEVSIGGGQIELTGIRAQVNITSNRAGRITSRTIKRSRAGVMYVNGESFALPAVGQLKDLPDDLGSVRVGVRERLGTRGLALTMVRITLGPNGEGGVINLGNARARINRG